MGVIRGAIQRIDAPLQGAFPLPASAFLRQDTKAGRGLVEHLQHGRLRCQIRFGDQIARRPLLFDPQHGGRAPDQPAMTQVADATKRPDPLPMSTQGLQRNCEGFGRRDFIQTGLGALGGLGLSQMLGMRAASAAT